MPFGDTPGFAVGRGRPDFMMPQGALITSALSNKGNPTGFGQDNTFRVLDQQEVRLVDGKGNLLFSGVGPEAAKQAVAMGQGISDEKGNKASWKIQTGDRTINTDGSVGGMRWVDVANEKKNTSPVGTILDIGLPILANALLPGSGLLSTMAGNAIGSAASGALQGKSIGDIAKSAGISAATAAILKRTPVGGYLDKAVSAVPVVGDVAKGLSKVVGSIPEIGGAGTGALSKALTDEIVVNAIRPVASSLAGSAISSSLANSIANKYPAWNPATAQPNLLPPPEAPYIDPLSDLTVTGTRLPGVSSFAVNPLAQNLIDQYAAKPTTQPTEQRTDNTDASEDIVLTGGRNPNLPFVAPTTKLFNNAQYSGGENVRDTQTADQEEQFKDGEEIIVTGREKLPITFPFGSLDKSIKDFAVDKYGKFEPTDQVIEKDPVTGEDEIIVTGRDSNFLLPGVSGALATATKPEFTQDLTEAPKKTTLDKVLDYAELAALGIGTLGSAFGGGGGGGGSAGRYSSKNALNPVFSAKLPTAGSEGSFTVGGIGGTAADRTLAARPVTDWYRYGMGPAMDIPAGADLSRATSPYAGYGPGTLGEETFKVVSGAPENPVGMSHGGDMGYSRGSSRESFAVEGPGTGRSDDIPAVLSDGEYVIDAETVALLGDGSSKAGAKKLDELRVKVRKHKGKNLAKGKFSVNAKSPEKYMSGGRI